MSDKFTERARQLTDQAESGHLLEAQRELDQMPYSQKVNMINQMVSDSKVDHEKDSAKPVLEADLTQGQIKLAGKTADDVPLDSFDKTYMIGGASGGLTGAGIGFYVTAGPIPVEAVLGTMYGTPIGMAIAAFGYAVYKTEQKYPGVLSEPPFVD